MLGLDELVRCQLTEMAGFEQDLNTISWTVDYSQISLGFARQ